MKQAELLMIPGPTPLPEPVREVLNRPAVGHRSSGFKEVLRRVFPNLQWAFKTKNPVFLYTASGTGAMEAAVSNVCNAEDRVLVLSNGVFSQRWAEIAKAFGMNVEVLSVPAGQAHTPAMLEEYLQVNFSSPFKAVFLNHSETSTGVLSPIRQLAAVVRKQSPDSLIVVDAITSLGAADFDFDGWDLDIAVSGSQKGFMLPPGLSFLAVSERAMKVHQECQNPGYYFNFTRYLKSQQEETTPYTPGTHLILGLDVALKLMREEGLPQIVARHQMLQRMTRAGVRALGLELFVPDDVNASPSVTSFLPPADVTVDDVRASLRKRFGIVIADGQKELKGKLMRIGHLGHVSERDVLTTVAALESVLLELGLAIKPGAAVAAAEQAKKERAVSHV